MGSVRAAHDQAVREETGSCIAGSCRSSGLTTPTAPAKKELESAQTVFRTSTRV
jgi:hypothetical protein